MGDKSHIQWTDATWNPLTGCTRVSSGCDNCYAARQAAGRLKNTPAYEGLATITPSGRAAFNGKIRLLPDRLDQPLRWRKPRRVFVNSMSDLFHPGVPDDFVDRVFAVMALAGRHTFQVLTKRPERAAEYLSDPEVRHRMARVAPWFSEDGDRSHDAILFGDWPFPNVWLGTSVENQAAADERIPHLLRTPAAVRFLSCEPLLGPVDLSWWLETLDREAAGLVDDPLAASLLQSSMREGLASAPTLGERLHWVIIGGESGPRARSFDIAWARSLIGQCHAAGVPAFVKQLGANPYETDFWPQGDERLRNPKGGDPSEWPEDLRVREFPDTNTART